MNDHDTNPEQNPTAGKAFNPKIGGPKATAFEAEIKPLLEPIFELAKTHKINMFACFALDHDAESIDVVNSISNTNDMDEHSGRREVSAALRAVQRAGANPLDMLAALFGAGPGALGGC